MSSREHWSDDGKLHVKVSTIHTNLAAYVEWGVEAWREKKHSIPKVFWKPWTWAGYEWRREGAPPAFTAVSFFRANDSLITNPDPPPVLVNQVGYSKNSLIYWFVGNTAPPDSGFLGNDARSVSRFTVTYTWNGQTKTLSDP